MATFDGLYIQGREVPLDGHDFRGCDFVDVTFRFDGNQGFAFDADCTFSGQIGLDLSDHARMILLTLSGMFNHYAFRPLIKRVIEREIAKGSDSFDDEG